MDQKIKIAIGVIVLILLGVGGYFLYKRMKNKTPKSTFVAITLSDKESQINVENVKEIKND